jgi:RHS repeat-associated protein
VRDERGRLKKLYKDVLGRLSKVEELEYNSAVFSTAVYEYNGRDQIEKVRHYQGTAQSGVYQERTFGYDGHARLVSRNTPEQGATTFGYNPDDTMQWTRDARGAKTAFTYNPRHLVTLIDYDVNNLEPGQSVADAQDITFEYDAAGGRTKMIDGVGTATYHYDSLGRMDWEERTFNGTGPFRLSYSYDSAGLASVTNPWGSQVSYTKDPTGAATAVTGAGSWSASVYAQNTQYRASGAVKSESYGNGRSLSVSYDNRLRVKQWDVPGVMGWEYGYNDFGENTGRVTYARNLYDATLSRSYDYDQVGRLFNSYTGTEALAHTGKPGGAWGVHDGPYSQAYLKDVWGNVTQKLGRAGDSDQFSASYTNNRRNGFSYDAAGNLTFDGGQSFAYDATGQQVSASYTGYTLLQSYDGDGLRVRKEENSLVTYYLRSSVLGDQVVSEINGVGGWHRGYVYGAGGNLLALQENGAVHWTHQDWASKSQRLVDTGGNVTAIIDLDPWGRETARSWNSQQQPRRFTSYERDGNQSDDAMMRRYNRWHLRFDQPDPYDGSLDLTSPQSFNRYTYANNDPVNSVDPTGLMSCYIDGMSSNCSTAFGLLGSGAAVVGPANSTRWNPNLNEGRGGFEYFYAFANGRAGWMTMQRTSTSVTVYGNVDGGYTSTAHQRYFDTTHPLGTITDWEGQLGFERGGIIRDLGGKVIGERPNANTDIFNPLDLIGGGGGKWVVKGLIFGGIKRLTWRSVKVFGHTFLTHGQGAKVARSLIGRAASTGKSQGQWLSNEAAASFLQQFDGQLAGPTGVYLPAGLGQIIRPDGSTAPALRAILIPKQGGGFRTAFPVE